MTREEAMLFINLAGHESAAQHIHDIAMKESPIYSILHSRLEAAGIVVSPLLKYWLGGLSNGVPGNAVLWAWTCASLPTTGETSDILIWASAFPTGVPTDQAYRDAWDAQKGRNCGAPSVDNMLDQKEVWTARPPPVTDNGAG
jgi:hypothetical protein